MAEYIERDAAVQAVMAAKWESGSDAAIAMEIIAGAPAADAAPVRHARWKINCDGYYPYCPECREEPKNGVMTKFCPNCGARMDLEAENG